MFISKIFIHLILCCFFVSVLCPVVLADRDQAWQALHELQISQAKELFRRELDKSPGDLSLMRGLLLSAHFDLDHATETEMIDALIGAEPGNPYLVPVFEHVAANYEGWTDHLDYELKIGRALTEHGDYSNKYIGRQIIESYCYRAMDSANELKTMKPDYAPGCWVSGPFENESQIAAYRKIPFEGEPLDTLASVFGKVGVTAGWTWVQSDPSGNLFSSLAIEDAAESAIQARIFFELPGSMEVLVLPGGGYGGRILLDGCEIYNDPLYRNAVMREGLLVSMQEGPHELTMSLSDNGRIVLFTLAIMDTNFEPIAGLKWLRYAKVNYRDGLTAPKIHPIFDSFNNFIDTTGNEPDTRYWKSILRLYNGYARELISELEQAFNNNEITALELWPLYIALLQNGETQLALEYLNLIRDVSTSPLIELFWTNVSASDYASVIKSFIELNSRYPDRVEIASIAALSPLLSGNVQLFVDSLMAAADRFPKYISHHKLLSDLYRESIQNPEMALDHFVKYCSGANYNMLLMRSLPTYYFELKKYDKALEAAQDNFYNYPYAYAQIQPLIQAYKYVHQEERAIALLDSLRERYPYDIEILSDLYDLYYSTGKYDESKQILQRIHILKPTAIKPYKILDSLHNFVTYDSIFGTIDAMELWDIEPTQEELGESNYWYLIDRRQKIVFQPGVVLSDVHTVRVLTDQDAVEYMQETNLGFNPGYWYNNLLTARRLRKGQPPVKGNINGSKVVFQDLQAGDAIELHYRIWEGNDGDLWKEFWDTYIVHTQYYQGYYEYSILTNRDDLRYKDDGPTPKPVENDYCGFRKISWQGEKIPAWKLDYSLSPPSEDIIGKIFISTIDNWDVYRRWYQSISDAILGKNPRSDHLADSLTSGDKTDMEKLMSLYRYIVLEIPYQVIDFNYDASIPHRPDDVLMNLWGDCKDKGHLLIQMLRRVGIDAWPVLTSTREMGSKRPLPYFGFNHLIISCVIDGDTLFVDASDLTYPVNHTLSSEVAGQPCLPINSESNNVIDRNPPYSKDDYHWHMNIMINHGDTGEYSFVDERKYYNQSAGGRRQDYFGMTEEELKTNFIAYYSDIWNALFTIDSIVHDDIKTINTVFNEVFYGKITLSTQTIGKSTIITPPIEPIINRSLLTYLGTSQQRRYDVDLRSYVGIYETSLEIIIPEEMGNPQMIDNIDLSESLYKFSLKNEWDLAKRTLVLNYSMEISDGHCDLDEFTEFTKQVLDLCNTPILLQRN